MADKAKPFPYFPFYPGDWMKSVLDLGQCSISAHGLWINLLCLMWESPKPGYLLLSNGTVPDTKTVSKILGISEEEYTTLFNELLSKNVPSFDEKLGTIYSRKMVREHESLSAKSLAGKKHRGNQRTNKKVEQVFQKKMEQAFHEKMEQPLGLGMGLDMGLGMGLGMGLIQGKKGTGEKGFPEDSKPYQLARRLWEITQTNYPASKEPNLQTWAKDFELILRIDKRELKDITKILDRLSLNDDWFWTKQIRSPGALRGKTKAGADRFVQILSSIEDDKPKKSIYGNTAEKWGGYTDE